MKKAIVSLANLRGNYTKGLARLSHSLRENFDGEFYGYIGEHTVNAPPHVLCPYWFKIFAIEEVRRKGVDLILWLDSSVYAIKDVQPAFDIIEEEGLLTQDAGCMLGNWCNDFTLEHFKLSRDEAMNIMCYGNAGMLGINFNSIKGREFFSQWKESMPFFKGAWTNENKTESQDERCKGHRHDLSVGTSILHYMGHTHKPGNQILQYIQSDNEEPNNDTIIFYAAGL